MSDRSVRTVAHLGDTPDLLARDARSIAGVGKLRFFPLGVVGGSGSLLRTPEGRELIDLSASWGAASLGYAHPAIAEVVSAAVRDMPAASVLSSVTEPAVRLAERLLQVTPGPPDRRVWFGHSGSDANEAALRCVLRSTGRKRIIAFRGAYHGGTVGSMAISGHPSLEAGERLPGLAQVTYPHPYRGDQDGSVSLAEFDKLLAGACPPEDVAAVWVEPIMSDGGVIVPPAGFLTALSERCSARGILLVCDEVKAGVGRSGTLHAFQADGVTPDIVCFGKGLGGGLPLSAFVAPAAVADHATAFAMLTTAGNPVCASAGIAVLDTVEREALGQRAVDLGARLMTGLSEVATRHDVIGDVRGRGLMVGLELVEDRTSRAPAPSVAAKVCYRAFELGIVLFHVGMDSNVLEFTPALTILPEQIDRSLEILDEAFADVAAGRVDDEIIARFSGW